MLEKILVTDLSTAESYAYRPSQGSAVDSNQEYYDLWITTVDFADKPKVLRINRLLKEKNIKHFFQLFADWSDEDSIQWKHLEESGPQLHNIQSIITFLKPYVEDNVSHNLGINCFAGVSRSTALAIVAHVMNGLTPEQALRNTIEGRLGAWPNIRVLRLASQVLNIDIVTPVAKWKNKIKNSPDLYTPGSYFI